MRKSDKQNAIVVATIVLCFMLTLGLCRLFSGEGFLKVFAESPSGETFYAITNGGYPDVALARSSAELIKSRGGAGYVVKGDKIEIIVAAYRNKENAQTALNKLGDKSAYLKEIPIAAPNMKWCSKDLLPSVEKALAYFDTVFDSLTQTASALSDQTKTIVDAKTEIDVLKGRINDLKSLFYSDTAGSDGEQITEIKLALVTALALIENVTLDKSIPQAVSSLRYQAVQLLFCRQALMNKI